MRGSNLNEEFRRKSNDDDSGSTYNIRGRSAYRNANVGQRNTGKSRGKEQQQNITCYECGREGHKKLDCIYFKMEQERKKNAERERKRMTRLIQQRRPT